MSVSPGQLGSLADRIPYASVVVPAVRFVVGFLVVYAVGRWVVVPAAGRVIRARNRNNPTLVTATRQYTYVLVVAVAVGVGVVSAGYGRLLTQSAIIIAAATLAVGVAGQAVIGNLVSGLFLVADPNFNVGDWIAWRDRSGTVESISYRVTRVRTANHEIVTVPNTELATNAVTRPYGPGRFRVVEEVGIEYDDDVEAARTCLREAATSLSGLGTDPDPVVRVSGFADSAVRLETRFWVRDPRRRDVLDVESEFREAVLRRFAAAGVTLSPASKRELSGSVDVAGGSPGETTDAPRR
ncbi:MAG: mechanosensitive ion channel family protein [Haloplanus sp.]